MQAAASAHSHKERCFGAAAALPAWRGCASRETCSVLRLVLGLLALPWWAA